MNTPQQRKGFTFYRSFRDAIKRLPQEEQLAVYNIIVDYALDSEEPNAESLGYFASILWTAFKPNLEADRLRYESGCKGGAPKGSINNPKGINQHKKYKDNQRLSSEDNQRLSNEDNQRLTSEDNQRLTNVNVKENVNVKVKENVEENVEENVPRQHPRQNAPTAERFTPPTISEIENYIQKQGYTDINANIFADYYASIGWQVGNAPMRDWKAALRRWHTRNKQDNNNLKSTQNEQRHSSTHPQNSPRLFHSLSDDEYLLDAQPRLHSAAADNSREG